MYCSWISRDLVKKRHRRWVFTFGLIGLEEERRSNGKWRKRKTGDDQANSQIFRPIPSANCNVTTNFPNIIFETIISVIISVSFFVSSVFVALGNSVSVTVIVEWKNNSGPVVSRAFYRRQGWAMSDWQIRHADSMCLSQHRSASSVSRCRWWGCAASASGRLPPVCSGGSRISKRVGPSSSAARVRINRGAPKAPRGLGCGEGSQKFFFRI